MLKKIGLVALAMVAGLATLAAPAEASTRPQVVNTCTTVARRPHLISWCDDSDYVIRIAWNTWGNVTAVGHGIMHNNTCRPSCAAGNYERFRVRITLYRVRQVGSHRRFTRARFYNAVHGPAVYWMPRREFWHWAPTVTGRPAS